MKRLIKIVCVLVAFLGILSSCARTDKERSKILKIYNWADYIDEEVLVEFPEWYKEQTGEDIRIIYQVFDINEIMLTKIERGHEDFDLICPSEYIIERMLKRSCCFLSTGALVKRRIIWTTYLLISRNS